MIYFICLIFNDMARYHFSKLNSSSLYSTKSLWLDISQLIYSFLSWAIRCTFRWYTKSTISWRYASSLKMGSGKIGGDWSADASLTFCAGSTLLVCLLGLFLTLRPQMLLLRTRFKTPASPSAECVFMATTRTTKSKVWRVDRDIVVVFLNVRVVLFEYVVFVCDFLLLIALE